MQIGVAETYNVIVSREDRAHSFVSEAIDRSGLGRATLAPREGMSAPIPPIRPRPVLTMKDMGMSMDRMDHSGMGGMEMPSSPNPAAVRGVDPSAEQTGSSKLWKLTGRKAGLRAGEDRCSVPKSQHRRRPVDPSRRQTQ